MKQKKIAVVLIIIVPLITILGITFMRKNSSNSTYKLSNEEIQSIQDKSGAQEITKTVQFNSEEEMYEYMNDVNRINGSEEAISFLNNFLNDCSENDPSLLIQYYQPYIREHVLENLMFPAIDMSNKLSFEISNISIQETKNENMYIAEYTLNIKDIQTKTPIAELKRKDTFEIYKQYERIYITNYKRYTADTKYL